MSICLYVSKILWTLYLTSKCANGTKLYIQLLLDENWCWLHIDGYRPIGGTAMPHFPRNFWIFKMSLISLGLWLGNKPNSEDSILIRQKSFWKFFVHIELQGALPLYIFLEFIGIFDFILSLDLLHRIKPNLVGKSFITSKYVGYMRVHMDLQKALLYYDTFSLNLVICLIFYISSSIWQNWTKLCT